MNSDSRGILVTNTDIEDFRHLMKVYLLANIKDKREEEIALIVESCVELQEPLIAGQVLLKINNVEKGRMFVSKTHFEGLLHVANFDIKSYVLTTHKKLSNIDAGPELTKILKMLDVQITETVQGIESAQSKLNQALKEATFGQPEEETTEVKKEYLN